MKFKIKQKWLKDKFINENILYAKLKSSFLSFWRDANDYPIVSQESDVIPFSLNKK